MIEKLFCVVLFVSDNFSIKKTIRRNPVALSKDHKPDKSDKRRRIMSCGGHLACRQVFVNQLWRVSAEPEISERIIDEFDDFIFLATDGSRQYCNYAVQIIHSSIKFEHKYMQEVDERNFLQLQTILLPV
jgi:serine/threonine protein phosphatase PrpC